MIGLPRVARDATGVELAGPDVDLGGLPVDQVAVDVDVVDAVVVPDPLELLNVLPDTRWAGSHRRMLRTVGAAPWSDTSAASVVGV